MSVSFDAGQTLGLLKYALEIARNRTSHFEERRQLQGRVAAHVLLGEKDDVAGQIMAKAIRDNYRESDL